MAQIFDMRRLHQGCGESLQSELLVLVKAGRRQSSINRDAQKQRLKSAHEMQKRERFLG
ncbi:MAG: hypothetical protein JAY97_05725 [Candidatus Thiodiazotropha sp. 'RUGA']|nr:hypothetical protein [Candidatus Thiodiazotropha sp. 'RUGA']